MRIGFFDGVREIGGNKILIEQNGRAILLDFGKRFAANNTYFNDYLPGREWNNPNDYVATGELPPFKHFYKNTISEDVKAMDVQIEGVFFSHAHLDHIGLIDFIGDSIPKYMSAYSREALHFFNEKGIIKKVKNVRIFDGPVEAAGFKVKPIPTDHDIPGSFATEIETPKGTIFYTGDIYFHGRYPEKSKQFVEYAKSKNPYILITEGTRFGWGAVISPIEEELKEEILSVLDQCEGLLFGNPYEPHISRMLTFFEVAMARNRNFVVTLPYAFVLKHYADIGDKNAQKILENKRTFVYNPRRELKEWEKTFQDKFIGAEDVNNEQKNTVMLLDFKSTPELLDIKPEKGAIYIHSGGEPLASLDAENTKILTNWLKLFKIPYFRIHTPGHAPQQKLLWMAREINPQILLPIHTQIPERFEIVSDSVKILERGVMYNF